MSAYPVHTTTSHASRTGVAPAADGGAVHALVAMAVSSTIERWSMSRLCAVSGVSARTLHRQAVREFGVSPMALIRRERLTRARTELLAGLQGSTVTSVALQWGFTHLGRFARDYARLFGESPSDTLRRARGHARHPGSRLGATDGLPAARIA